MTFCILRFLLGGLEDFDFRYIILFGAVGIALVYAIDFLYKMVRKK